MSITINGTGPATFDASGNLGVGTASPTYKLDVQGTSDTVIRAKGTSGTAGGIFSADGNGSGSYPGYNLAQSGTTYWSMQQRGDTNFYIYRQSGSGDVIIPSGNLQFNSGYGSAVTAYGCRAWVNFAGASGTRNGSGNVTSVTRNSTGNYTINFTTAMPDANYAATGSYIGSNSNGVSCVSFYSISTTSIGVIATTYAANTDATNIFVTVFR